MSDISVSPYGFGNAPRGQDPMGQANQVSNSYQPHPMARFIGQMMDYLQDPRVGMAFPGAGLARMGFRAGGGAASRALDMSKKTYEMGGAQMDQQAMMLAQRARMEAETLERQPLPHQMATTMRQPDNGMARMKALDSLKQSNGWTDDQLREWLSKQSN